jgi:hypothetical protein
MLGVCVLVGVGVGLVPTQFEPVGVTGGVLEGVILGVGVLLGVLLGVRGNGISINII